MAWKYKVAAAAPYRLGRYVVKSARFDRLLASTALVLVLALSSHSSMAQQGDSRVVVAAAVPVPDTTLPPPPTAKDLAATPAPAAPAQAAPAAEPAPPDARCVNKERGSTDELRAAHRAGAK